MKKTVRIRNSISPVSIARTKFLRVFSLSPSPSRHVDVIEGNLPREVGSLRGSDYNTSEFIHRRDSNAPEVTRRECFPEVGCVRASARVVNFSSGTRRSGWRACNVRVYSGVPCGTGNCERGEEKRERDRERVEASRALSSGKPFEREERFEKKNVQLGRRTGRKRKRRERGTRMRSWRRIAGCRTTKQRPARRTVAPWRTPRFSCPEDGLLSVEGGTSCVRDERRSILTWRPRCFMNLIVPLRRGASPRWAHDYAAEESDA